MRWALIISVFYFVLLVVLVLPLFLLAVWIPDLDMDSMRNEAKEIYQDYALWVIAFCFALGQFLLLFLKVKELPRDRKPKARLWGTACLMGLFAGVLFVGAGLSLIELFKIDGDIGLEFETTVALFIGIPWFFWMLYFYFFHRNDELNNYFDHGFLFLLKGSAFELMICLPAHIIVRQRTDCCAGVLTGLGLACGFSVMLLCFGPVVLALIYKRIQIKKQK